MGAVKALGMSNAQDEVGRVLHLAPNRLLRIVGVSPAVKQESARVAGMPQMFWISEKPKHQLVLMVRGKNPVAARQALTEVWPRFFPNDRLDINSVDQLIADLYKVETRYGALMAMCGVLALILAGFGVYALAAYTVQRHTREIVLRKLHGAKGQHIVGLLVKEIAPLLLAGAVLGLGLAWFAGQHYLSGFVDRAPVGVWPLVAALGLVALTTVLTTARHMIAALRLRPLLALAE